MGTAPPKGDRGPAVGPVSRRRVEICEEKAKPSPPGWFSLMAAVAGLGAQSLKRKSVGGGAGGGSSTTLRSVPPELLPELAKKLRASESLAIPAIALSFVQEHPGPSVRQVRICLLWLHVQ